MPRPKKPLKAKPDLTPTPSSDPGVAEARAGDNNTFMQGLASGVETILSKRFFEAMGFVVIIAPMEGEALGAISWVTNLDHSCVPALLEDIAKKIEVQGMKPQGSA